MLNLHSDRETFLTSCLEENLCFIPALMQILKPYFQYIKITTDIVFVHIFHNDINEQCEPAFYLRTHMIFFGEPQSTYQNQDIPATLLSVSIEEFMWSQTPY